MGVAEGGDGGFPDDTQLLTLCSESSSNDEQGGRLQRLGGWPMR